MLPVKRRSLALKGVGVDLISRQRVRRFLSRHRAYVLRRFLNRSEKREFGKISLQGFAELFAAKEAFFKACGESWMGLQGFRGMRMRRRATDLFEMEWRPARCRKAVYRGQGRFFRSGDLIGAQAMVWR
ncbi:MAG: 4'-phosphopantetheinyl transferase superfamily protein [Candidatus Omnitrophica bacterium]|nr:4'-phosphopantetheinyl transferase superfamily protein [Candidatus Omnitrophota bacterium]